MRKSRIKLYEVDLELLEVITIDPNELIFELDLLEIIIPQWATLMLVGCNLELQCLDFMIFEETQDFFLRYAKQAIENPEDVSFYSFIEKETGWELFGPPTLIGENLHTRLRSNQIINE